MYGVVLCGGQSTRMGSDKGLLWAGIVAEKLRAFGIPVVISINPGQRNAYLLAFPAESLVADDSAVPVKGPLLGVLTVHRFMPSEDLLVLACDMPGFPADLISQILERRQADPSYDAYVYYLDAEPEPLCGLYTSRGLTAIGIPERFSMKAALGRLNVCQLTAGREHFKSLNSPDDLTAGILP